VERITKSKWVVLLFGFSLPNILSMSDWAEKAAQKASEQDAIRQQNVEKANRDAKVKGEIGPELFKQLRDWIGLEVAKYNQLRNSDELFMKVEQADNPTPELYYDSIIVGRRDGKKGPLKIKYSPITGIISYECGGGKGEFTLKITDGDKAQFETPYHQVKSIEEIGEELLNKWQNSQF